MTYHQLSRPYYHELRRVTDKKTNELLILQCYLQNNFQEAIECLQNLLGYDGSRDAHLTFQNGGNNYRWEQL